MGEVVEHVEEDRVLEVLERTAGQLRHHHTVALRRLESAQTDLVFKTELLEVRRREYLRTHLRHHLLVRLRLPGFHALREDAGCVIWLQADIADSVQLHLFVV